TETLTEHVRPRQLLLVLDNCEHLLTACAVLVEALLAGSPALRVLATSRQSLGLTGEVAWPLGGLTVPPALGVGGWGLGVGGCDGSVRLRSRPTPNPQRLTPEALLQFEAVALFMERAAGAAPGFSLTERTAGPAEEICRRLEGMPLAIELAAARLKTLSVEE